MFRYFVIFTLLLFVVGCGSVQPSTERPSNLEDGQTNLENGQAEQLPVGVVTTHQFNFPGTGWYMDFRYDDGFYVYPQGNIIAFVIGNETVTFQWDTKLEPDMSTLPSEDFVGRGWWGKKYVLQNASSYIRFKTPDNKYDVAVIGQGDVFDGFVQGMVMGK